MTAPLPRPGRPVRSAAARRPWWRPLLAALGALAAAEVRRPPRPPGELGFCGGPRTQRRGRCGRCGVGHMDEQGLEDLLYYEDEVSAFQSRPPSATQKAKAKAQRRKQKELRKATELSTDPERIRAISGSSDDPAERASLRELKEAIDNEEVVAVDAEWDQGDDSPLAVVQLAFPKSATVFLLQLSSLEVPKEVRKMLASEAFQKVVWSWDVADRSKFAAAGIEVRNFVDMQPVVGKKLGSHRVGLSWAAEQFLQYRMRKRKGVAESQWSAAKLTSKQQKYAAMDAWVQLRLYEKLQKVRLVGV